MKILSLIISSIGVSSIIATILMLIIITSLSGLTYLYISGTLTSRTAQSFSIISTYADTVTIQNDGTLPLSTLTATVDGNDVPIAVIPNIGGSVAYWSFNDQNNPTADNSGNGNDGTFNGEIFNDGTIYEAQRVDGKFGKALSFDGTGDYVQIDESNDFDLDVFTQEVWIYPTVSDSSWNTILDIDNDEFQIAWRNGYIDLYRGSCGNYGRSSVSLSTNQWHHIVIIKTADATNNVKMYINGIPDNISTCNFASLDADHFMIGNGFGTDQEFFVGTIDEVRIFNRALSPEEIQDEMQSSRPTIRPVASYSFEETGQYANDTHVLVKGEYDSALSFDGVNDYVEVPNDPSLDIDYELTATVWFKLDSLSSEIGHNEYIVHRKTGVGDPGPYESFIIYTEDDGSGEYISCALANSSGDRKWPYNRNNGNFLQKDVWYHVACVYDGSQGIVYLNGGPGSPHSLPGPLYPSTGVLRIGAGGDSYGQVNGTINDVRIFNRALSQEEISSLYSGLVSAGQIATVKFLTALTLGTHTIRLCTSGMCQGGYLTII